MEVETKGGWIHAVRQLAGAIGEGGNVDVTSESITDATDLGKGVLTAATEESIRTLIGAGTSDLVLGTGGTNAKPGNYTPAWSEVTGKPTVIAAGSNAEQAREAVGALAESEKGVAGGVATLDDSGQIPLSQINLEGLSYKGLWNASTNTPALANGVGEDADFYFSAADGTVDLGNGEIEFFEGDAVIYHEGMWSRRGSNQIVQSVNGKIGVVEITAEDVGALPETYAPTWDDIQNKPALPALQRGNISPPVPAVRQYLETNQSIPVSTNTQVSNWGDGYDHFGMRVDGNFIVPLWASYARVTCAISSEYIQTGRFLHVDIRRNGTSVGEGLCPGIASLKYPVARADTGIMSVSPGDVFMVVVWHNADTPKNTRSGARSMINIELFEAI